MAYALPGRLYDLPKGQQQAYLRLPTEYQMDLILLFEEKGYLPPVRRWPILFGPELSCYIEPEPHGWMLM